MNEIFLKFFVFLYAFSFRFFRSKSPARGGGGRDSEKDRSLALNIVQLARSKEGCTKVKELIPRASTELLATMFDIIKPEFRELMRDIIASHVMDALFRRFNVDQLEYLLEIIASKEDIIELATDRYSTFPFRNLLEAVNNALQGHLESSIRRNMTDDMEHILNVFTKNLRSLACHIRASRVILSLLLTLPRELHKRFVSDLIIIFDDLANEHYGSQVIEQILKTNAEDIIDFVIRRIREGRDSPGENPLVKCLKSKIGHSIARRVIESASKDQLKIIDHFAQDNKDIIEYRLCGSDFLKDVKERVYQFTDGNGFHRETSSRHNHKSSDSRRGRSRSRSRTRSNSRRRNHHRDNSPATHTKRHRSPSSDHFEYKNSRQKR